MDFENFKKLVDSILIHGMKLNMLLFLVITGINFLGFDVNPTSGLRLINPRVELHLFYCSIVTVQIKIAVIAHMVPTDQMRADLKCTCAVKF